MAKHPHERLTRREREIMNAVFALENRASAEDIRARLAKGRDPWADFASTRQTITQAAAERVGFRLKR